MEGRRCRCCRRRLPLALVVAIFLSQPGPGSSSPLPDTQPQQETPLGLPAAGGGGLEEVEGRASNTTVADVVGSNAAAGEQQQQQVPLATLGDRKTLLQVLSGMEKVVHFVDEVDQNHLLSEDLVDKSWLHWLTTRMNKFTQIMQDPNKSLWDAMVQMMIRSEQVGYMDKSETGDVDVTFTTVMFDPIGSLFKGAMQTMESMPMFYSIKDWWERVQKDYNRFANIKIEGPLIEKVTEAPKEDDKPDGVLSIAPYDPLVVGVNSLIKWGWHILFMKYLMFTSGWENAFLDVPILPLGGGGGGVVDNDNYDYYDEEFEEFIQGDEDGDGDGDGEGDGDGDGDGDGGGDDGGGGGGGGDEGAADYDYGYDYAGGQPQYDYYDQYDNYDYGRRRRKSSYSYLYYDPSYAGRSRVPGRMGDVSRSDDPRGSRNDDPASGNNDSNPSDSGKATSSSSSDTSQDYIYGNTFGHGVGGPHVAVTLGDLNLTGKRK